MNYAVHVQMSGPRTAADNTTLCQLLQQCCNAGCVPHRQKGPDLSVADDDELVSSCQTCVGRQRNWNIASEPVTWHIKCDRGGTLVARSVSIVFRIRRPVAVLVMFQQATCSALARVSQRWPGWWLPWALEHCKGCLLRQIWSLPSIGQAKGRAATGVV